MSEVWNDCHFGVLIIGPNHLAFTLGNDVLLAVLRPDDPVANEEFE